MYMLDIKYFIFAFMLVGYASSKCHIFHINTSELLVRLLFYILMPIILFFEVARLPIAETLSWGYISTYTCVYIITFTLSAIISQFFFKRNTTNTLLNAMASTHPNAVYIALPLFLLLFKTSALIATTISLQTCFNFFMLAKLDLLTTKHSINSTNFYIIARTIIRTPILTGILLGLVFSFFHITFPESIYSTFNAITYFTSSLALFALGLSLGASSVKFDKQQRLEILTLVFLKSLLHPLFAFLIGHYVFSLNSKTLIAVILMAAMPTAKSLFIVAKRYEANTSRINTVIFITTIFSAVTINVIFLIESYLSIK